MEPQRLENALTRIAEMCRAELIDLLLHCRCSFPTDFTREYLETLEIERLRHVAMAALLHAEAGLT